MNRDNKSALEIMTRELRLLYYNNYLFKNDVITSREHNKLNLAIISKYGKRMRNESGVFHTEEHHNNARHI